MVTIEELKLGNRTLEALKFLLEQITELETAVSQINISEIKDANTLTKEQIATLQDVKSAVEAISSDLNLKKSDFDEKKQIFDINMSAFINDKADFDEKKADFDSKNNTALSNFAFISSNVEKINSTSALLAEAKTVLETIKPMEQRTQAALDTIVNSHAKFAELEALKTTLLELKRSLENISTTGLITDTKVSTTQTYSSKKIEDLVSNAKTTLTADIKSKTDSLTTIMNNQKQSITTLDSKINSTQGNLNNLTSSVSTALEQKADKTTFNTFVANTTNNLNLKANKNDVPSVTALEATFMKKTDKIDAYTKQESNEKFALKTELQKAIPVGSYLLYSSNSNIPDGFLRCDGSALDKNTYAELFSVLGYTYGRSGDRFLLPNFSDGKFMRSIGGNAAALGTTQGDAIDVSSLQLNSYTGDNAGSRDTYGTNSTAEYRAVAYTYSKTGSDIGYRSTAGKNNTAIFSSTKKANENRPLNMAVVVLIKY